MFRPKRPDVNHSVSRANADIKFVVLVLDYALERGLILNNPATGIKRRKIVTRQIQVPSREQFTKLVETLHDSYSTAKAGDLVELMAYSGCRPAEAASLRWCDVNGRLTVNGTKTESARRTVPMTPALVDLLKRLKEKNPDARQHDRIVSIESPKKGLQTACKKLGLPYYSPYTFRHLFATTCIESGVDIPTVAKWMGHKDGGALAMRTYGHLRAAHSDQQATKVQFGVLPEDEKIVKLAAAS